MLPPDYRTHDPLIDRHLVDVDERVASRRSFRLWTATLIVAGLLVGTGVLVWLAAQ